MSDTAIAISTISIAHTRLWQRFKFPEIKGKLKLTPEQEVRLLDLSKQLETFVEEVTDE